MGFETIEIEIEGTTPLLMNKFTDEAQMAATSGSRASTAGQQKEPREDADSRIHKDESGRVIMPEPCLRSCITTAGKYFKSGRTKVTTQKSSLLSGAMSFDALYYNLKSDGWKVDTRPIRNPVTGGRILRHRPCFDNWRVRFSIEIDTDIIPTKLFREIVDVAGSRVGLCDFRPDCKGPFGKFKVVHWKNGKS